jgi:hypothetical protein
LAFGDAALATPTPRLRAVRAVRMIFFMFVDPDLDPQ